MQSLTLYRKRLIPNECVLLKDDRILFSDPDMLMTAWETLKPKKELAFGYSCFLLKKGFKISRFYDHSGRFMYWYCDIIQSDFNEASDTWVFTDLLVDLIVHPDGRTEILDLDELSQAARLGLIDEKQLCQALDQLHALLQTVYTGRFDLLTAPLLDAEKEDRRKLNA